MNNSTTLQFMDKQIMDLSNSQSSATVNSNNTGEFIDFLNRSSEKKDDIIPSYDFMPIRPIVGSSSPPPPSALRSSNFGSGGDDDDAPIRTWSSLDSKPSGSAVRNYNSLDADEPAKFVKNQRPVNSSLDVSSEIDRTMKKYTDNLMHAIEGVSARLSQLETRTRNLENLVDDLKVSVEDSHGNTHRDIRQLENILGEVQTSVRAIRDKQDIVEAQLQLAKLHIPKVEQTESQQTTYTDTRSGASAHQQFSTGSLARPPPSAIPPDAPPPLPPQPNFQHQAQLPNQYPQNQVPSVPQRESYFPPTGHTPENQSQQYQIPPPPQAQPQPQLLSPPPPPHPSQPPQTHPNQPQPPQTHPNQPQPPNQYHSPPQPQYSPPPPPPPSQPYPSFIPVNPSLPQLSLAHHPEEASYAPSQTHLPPPQQSYGPPSNVYEPPTNTLSPRYSSSFSSSLGHGEPYPYSSSPSQYGSGSPMKGQNLSSIMGQSGGGGYPQLPTARILPQAIPMAASVGSSGSGSGGSGNKVPIDDVVDKVTNMGFPRDQVRATVRRLTENGQAVDLNIVLDKLMNDGEGQARGDWFSR